MTIQYTQRRRFVAVSSKQMSSCEVASPEDNVMKTSFPLGLPYERHRRPRDFQQKFRPFRLVRRIESVAKIRKIFGSTKNLPKKYIFGKNLSEFHKNVVKDDFF